HGISADRVVVAGESDFLSPAVLHEIERICQKRQIELSFLPRMMGVTEWSVPPIESHPTPVPHTMPGIVVPSYFRLKRAIDVFGSLILLVFLSPLLLLGCLLVLLDVGLPILFWQERLGWKRQSFLIYKFRTLRAPFDPDGKPTGSGREPSAIGRFL